MYIYSAIAPPLPLGALIFGIDVRAGVELPRMKQGVEQGVEQGGRSKTTEVDSYYYGNMNTSVIVGSCWCSFAYPLVGTAYPPVVGIYAA